MLLTLLAAAPAHAAPDRYAFAGGCYSVNGLAGAEQVRMQAADLGAYLLYRPDGTYVTPSGVSSSPAIWTLDAGVTTLSSGGVSKPVSFAPASGCAVFPEADLNATGTPSAGTTPFGEVGGLIDGHMHWMTYEYLGGNFHCGAPWSALRDHRRAARLLVDRGPAGHRGAVPELPQLRQPGRSRTTRAATRI